MKAFSVLRLLITTGLVTTSLATTDRVGASPTSTDTSSGARADTELLAVTRLLESAQSTTEAAFEYEADRFVDHVDGDSLVLEGHAVVLHKCARLEADRMVFFRDRHVIVATSPSRVNEQDSSRRTVDQVAGPADSSRLSLDSTVQQGPGTRPRLSRGDDVLE